MSKNGWHRADIIAAIHKRGSSLAQLGRENGLGDSTLRASLHTPRTPSNRIIAAFLGASLHDLWPAWFDRNGRLIGGRKAARARRRAASQNRAAA
jgi:Ner family transcriptional regulator